MVVEDIDHLVSRILSRALVRFPWKVWKADTRVTLRGNRKWISEVLMPLLICSDVNARFSYVVNDC